MPSTIVLSLLSLAFFEITATTYLVTHPLAAFVTYPVMLGVIAYQLYKAPVLPGKVSYV